MKTLILVLLALTSFTSINQAYGQSCRPAVLKYVVRDEKGKYLSMTELEAVYKQMPPAQSVNSVTRGVSTVRLTKKGTLVGYSTEATKTELPAIYYAEAGECRLKISEFTLEHAARKMHLIFDLDIDRRTFAIDSLPFQNGTFKLDQTGLSNAYYEKIVSARRWKKVSSEP